MALARILCTPVLPMLGSASELLDIFKHVKQLVFLKLIIVSTILWWIKIFNSLVADERCRDQLVFWTGVPPKKYFTESIGTSITVSNVKFRLLVVA